LHIRVDYLVKSYIHDCFQIYYGIWQKRSLGTYIVQIKSIYSYLNTSIQEIRRITEMKIDAEIMVIEKDVVQEGNMEADLKKEVIEMAVGVLMEDTLEMIEVATEAMEEIDLNVDLTVVENILVEMIEIEVPEVVIDNLRFNLGTLLTIAGLYLIFNFKILCQIFMLSHCKL